MRIPGKSSVPPEIRLAGLGLMFVGTLNIALGLVLLWKGYFG